MKSIIVAVAVLLVVAFAIDGWSRAPKYVNKKREAEKIAEYEETIAQIPIHRGKLKGDYDLLGPVHGEDAFTKNNAYITRKLRSQAYKMGGDAIMEFKCRRIAKSLFQTCDGFAVKFRSEKHAPQ